MINLTLQDVLAHQSQVLWPQLYQVEQDLLLCMAMAAIFNDDFLSSQVAMRGGTVLHKVHLAPASRYSEDIDLVVVGERPEEHIRAALKRVLKNVLGKEQSSAWDHLKLAMRNAAKPSRILRVIYEVPSVSDPGRLLTIEVEANVSERRSHLPVVKFPFEIPFRGAIVSADIYSYDINEMLATKMRALFQRQKGRDLFDLYRALSSPADSRVDKAIVISCFMHYMSQEGTVVSRDEFLEHLAERLSSPSFCSDMDVLLLADFPYNVQAAGALVRDELLANLPS